MMRRPLAPLSLLALMALACSAPEIAPSGPEPAPAPLALGAASPDGANAPSPQGGFNDQGEPPLPGPAPDVLAPGQAPPPPTERSPDAAASWTGPGDGPPPADGPPPLPGPRAEVKPPGGGVDDVERPPGGFPGEGGRDKADRPPVEDAGWTGLGDGPPPDGEEPPLDKKASPSSGPAPIPKVEPTPAADLPDTPFTAWTTTAPITLVGPGGVRVATLKEYGVRLEVEQILDSRVRVICTGCGGDAEGKEAWVQPDTFRASRARGGKIDPLTQGLRSRASWAQSQDLPGGATNADMCRLIDRGFSWDGTTAQWTDAGLTVHIQWDADNAQWNRTTSGSAQGGPPWQCRTSGARPPNARTPKRSESPR